MVQRIWKQIIQSLKDYSMPSVVTSLEKSNILAPTDLCRIILPLISLSLAPVRLG